MKISKRKSKNSNTLENSKKFVTAVMNDENVKASTYLKSILKKICVKRISNVLRAHNRKQANSK